MSENENLKLGLTIDAGEALQIIISVLAISFAFAIVFAGIGSIGHPREFLVFMFSLVVTVGSGFILHEMAHKLVAMYYGARARFVMWTQGLVIMLITSLFGFLFAAPGAVYIYADKITKKENGIISVAGPMTNIAIALVFIGLQLFAPINQYFTFLAGDLGLSGYGIINGTLQVWRFGAAINLMLALFNMIPAFPLDGSKVFAWSKFAWLALVLLLLGFGAVLISPVVIFGWAFMLAIAVVLSKFAFG